MIGWLKYRGFVMFQNGIICTLQGVLFATAYINNELVYSIPVVIGREVASTSSKCAQGN